MAEHVGKQFGDYRIAEPIGAGGMGAVYLAEHVHLRKKYALKILPNALACDQDFVARFHDEARLMAELRHEHIVQVHHMGHVDGVYYLVMDYVTGPNGKPLSLHEHVKEQPDGRLPEAQVRKWAIQVAEALAYAHGRGVVHRDLKPANILLDENGNALLTDFGLAKAIGREFILSQIHDTMRSLGSLPTQPATSGNAATDTLDAAVTRSPGGSGSASSILGTYDYMAPEQRGDGLGQIDERTDIYSFGVVLYRLLTGKRPVGIARPPSRAVRTLSRHWDPVVTRCLAQDPAERQQSAACLLAELARIGRGRRWPVVAASCAVLLLGVAAIVTAYMVTRPADPMESRPLAGRSETQVSPESPATQPVAPAVDGPTQPAELADSPPGDAEQSQVASDLSEVVPVRVEAELAWRKVSALDRGQGFGSLLDQAERIWLSAETFLEREAWREALAAYQRLLEECDKLDARERLRDQAQAARRRAAETETRARNASAPSEAPDTWRSASDNASQAQHAFDSGELSAARVAWDRAAQSFEQARTEATGATKARDSAEAAKHACQAARTEAVNASAQDNADELLRSAEKNADRAQDSFDQRRYTDAKSQWEQAAVDFRSAAHHARGVQRVAAARKRFDTARDATDFATIERYGGNAAARINGLLAQASRSDEDFDQAVQAYDDAAKLTAQAFKLALLAKAKAHDDSKNGRTALEALRRLLQIDPNHREAKNLQWKIEGYYAARDISISVKNESQTGLTVAIRTGGLSQTLQCPPGASKKSGPFDADAKEATITLNGQWTSGGPTDVFNWQHTIGVPQDNMVIQISIDRPIKHRREILGETIVVYGEPQITASLHR